METCSALLALCEWPLGGEYAGDQWISLTKGQLREAMWCVSIYRSVGSSRCVHPYQLSKCYEISEVTPSSHRQFISNYDWQGRYEGAMPNFELRLTGKIWRSHAQLWITIDREDMKEPCPTLNYDWQGRYEEAMPNFELQLTGKIWRSHAQLWITIDREDMKEPCSTLKSALCLLVT